MKIVTDKSKYLKNIFKIIDEFVIEATMKVDAEGLKIRTADPSNVCLIDLIILKGVFNTYQFNENEIFTLKINDLKKFLDFVGSEDLLTLEVKDNKFFINTKSKNSSKNFSLPLIDADLYNDKEAKIDFKSSTIITSTMFKDAINASKTFAEEMFLNIKKNGITFEAHSDLKNFSTHYNIRTECIEESYSMYSLNYLEKVSKLSILSDKLHIDLSTDMPVKFSCRIPDVLKASIILAPRVKND